MPTILTLDYPPPKAPFTSRDAASITDFVVHHSAGPLTQTPLDIDRFERQNGDIFMPYTWLIDSAGNIYDGRPPLAVSAATFGRNAESVACCLIGNFQADAAGFDGPPAPAQFSASPTCAYGRTASFRAFRERTLTATWRGSFSMMTHCMRRLAAATCCTQCCPICEQKFSPRCSMLSHSKTFRRSKFGTGSICSISFRCM